MRLALLMIFLCLSCAAQPGLFEVAVSINIGSQERAFRGWPLIVRAYAALSADTDEPVSLDGGPLVVSVFNSFGQDVSLPFELVMAAGSGQRLNPENDSARIVWLLNSQETTRLQPGKYSIRVTWGGAGCLASRSRSG